MQDETILYDPGTNRFALLNRTASLLWAKLETPCTLEQLSTAIRGSFAKVDSPAAERDVQQALDQLKELAFVTAEA